MVPATKDSKKKAVFPDAASETLTWYRKKN